MRFDSHVVDLLKIAADLVNAQTCVHAGGRPAHVPSRRELRDELGGILAREGRRPAVEERDVRVLARFAQDARRIFEAAADEDLDSAAAATNELLSWARPMPRLDKHGSAWDMHFHGPTDRLGDGWAAGCAAALTMALGSAGAGRLGVCAAPDCDRAYVDRSKNGTRSFCGIVCQNRVKNVRHRRTRRASRREPTRGSAATA
ncbi:CGNR zinc finger domain-containing protein [Jiangella rhizosphaerae]|uniref:CGNR zinc finger domain-containing protein n=1 Tax=Jiangella rhizosphaerae TaxID=2293569 RepID=A0A418KRZ7_9ACTN|nr:CGNR zinc finger domain-containing protein [Jiangella rhizosphaerae]RIQ26294.1 CGNR zinc finger domain-containing protein [Jiangella rhizosphaerae]